MHRLRTFNGDHGDDRVDVILAQKGCVHVGGGEVRCAFCCAYYGNLGDEDKSLHALGAAARRRLAPLHTTSFDSFETTQERTQRDDRYLLFTRVHSQDGVTVRRNCGRHKRTADSMLHVQTFVFVCQRCELLSCEIKH
nr:hypothetical protein BaRGS_005813 [Batillaria attramentaria]